MRRLTWEALVRVLRLAIYRRLAHKLIHFRMLFKSRSEGLILEDRWLDSISPIGSNPFTKVVPFTSWASE